MQGGTHIVDEEKGSHSSVGKWHSAGRGGCHRLLQRPLPSLAEWWKAPWEKASKLGMKNDLQERQREGVSEETAAQVEARATEMPRVLRNEARGWD